MKEPTTVVLLEMYEVIHGIVILHQRRSDADKPFCKKTFQAAASNIGYNRKCEVCARDADRFTRQRNAELAAYRAFNTAHDQEANP